MKARALISFAAIAVLLTPFSVAAENVQSAEYTLGHSVFITDLPVFGSIQTASLCGDAAALGVRVEGVGGDCDFFVQPGQTAAVEVTDDVLGSAVEFTAIPIVSTAGAITYCGTAHHAVGSVEFVIPAGCYGLAVFVTVGATTGIIVVRTT